MGVDTPGARQGSRSNREFQQSYSPWRQWKFFVERQYSYLAPVLYAHLPANPIRAVWLLALSSDFALSIDYSNICVSFVARLSLSSRTDSRELNFGCGFLSSVTALSELI